MSLWQCRLRAGWDDFEPTSLQLQSSDELHRRSKKRLTKDTPSLPPPSLSLSLSPSLPLSLSPLLALPHAGGGTPFENEYKGCFMERVGRALPVPLGDSRDMTPQLCRQLALRNASRYWATTNVTQCFAGNIDPTYLAASKSDCTTPCPGNSKLKCGGPGEVFVHEIPQGDREWVGCYEDPTLAYGNFSIRMPDLTPQRCRKWAVNERGLAQYGMQGPDLCFGIARSTPPELNPASGCTERCAGDLNQACGGPAGVSSVIYQAVFNQQGVRGALRAFVCFSIHLRASVPGTELCVERLATLPRAHACGAHYRGAWFVPGIKCIPEPTATEAAKTGPLMMQLCVCVIRPALCAPSLQHRPATSGSRPAELGGRDGSP